MKFYELAIGARFFFSGRRFEKLGMSMAEDEGRAGHVFMGDAEVTADGGVDVTSSGGSGALETE